MVSVWNSERTVYVSPAHHNESSHRPPLISSRPWATRAPACGGLQRGPCQASRFDGFDEGPAKIGEAHLTDF